MLKFYYNLAPNPTKVALCLEEMGLPYELVPVDTRKGEQHKPEFLAINPNAKVPAIVDGDATVFDSNAILLYLAEKTGKFLPANSPAARGEMLSWLMFVAIGHRPLFGPGGAFPQLRARAQGLRGQPLQLRGAAPLGHPRRAPGKQPLHGAATPTPSSTWRCGAGRGCIPFVLGPDAAEQLPNLQAPPRRDQRPPGGRARPRAEGPAHLQDRDGRGGAPGDVPASRQEGRLIRRGPRQRPGRPWRWSRHPRNGTSPKGETPSWPSSKPNATDRSWSCA